MAVTPTVGHVEARRIVTRSDYDDCRADDLTGNQEGRASWGKHVSRAEAEMTDGPRSRSYAPKAYRNGANMEADGDGGLIAHTQPRRTRGTRPGEGTGTATQQAVPAGMRHTRCSSVVQQTPEVPGVVVVAHECGEAEPLGVSVEEAQVAAVVVDGSYAVRPTRSAVGVVRKGACPALGDLSQGGVRGNFAGVS